MEIADVKGVARRGYAKASLAETSMDSALTTKKSKNYNTQYPLWPGAS